MIVPKSRWFTPRAYSTAIRRVLEFDPDVLICSLWRSVPVALAVKQLRPRTKVAFFLHSAFTTNVVDKQLSALAMRAADAIWTDSRATLGARVPPELLSRTRVLSFVTEKLARARSASAPPQPRFVSWGRLHHYKGVDQAIRFIAHLVAQGVDATFDVWGPDSGALPELKALRRACALETRVRFRGPAQREALPDLARTHSFFLGLSRFEGMAMSVVEAMQLGLVPVVTRVGEIPNYAAHGQNAVLVNPSRFEDAAQEVRALLDDAGRYARVAERAAAHWKSASLYADDVCEAACRLASVSDRP